MGRPTQDPTCGADQCQETYVQECFEYMRGDASCVFALDILHFVCNILLVVTDSLSFKNASLSLFRQKSG